jgi:hypothetical protein
MRARSKEKGVVVLVGGSKTERFFREHSNREVMGDTLSTRSTFVVVDPMKKSGERLIESWG